MLQIARTGSGIPAALLQIGGLSLLLPQSEIRTLESATDIEAAAPALHSVGWMRLPRSAVPVPCWLWVQATLE
jgi:hypothetical protein